MKTTEKIVSIPLDKLHISKLNTRQPKATDPAVKELALSIKTFEQSTPAIVRRFKGKTGHYEIGAGSRRSVASKIAGNTTLDCVIRDYTDKEFEELILVENLQRENPDPKSEAKNLLRLVALDGDEPDIAGVASRLGKSPEWVARRTKLLSVIPALRKHWEKDELEHFSIQMMELLGSLPKSLQKEFSEDLPWQLTNCDSYRELNALIERHYSCRLDDAPFPLDDPAFYGTCGGECSANSEDSPLLFSFDDDKKNCARCLDASCFLQRLEKWRAHKLAEVEKGETDLIYFSSRGRAAVRRKDGSTITGLSSMELERNYKLKRGKKSDEGSRRAINMTNPDKPSSVYLVPVSGAVASEEDREEVPQDKEKLKRDRLQARRWKLVYGQLCEAIKKSTSDQVIANVFETAAYFGLSYSLSSSSGKDWKGFDNRAKPQEHHRYCGTPGKKLTLEQRAWEGLKDIFMRRLEHNRVIDCLGIIKEMERIAELIGYDLNSAKEKADTEVPPPKSWGKVDIHTLK